MFDVMIFEMPVLNHWSGFWQVVLMYRILISFSIASHVHVSVIL